jgi:fructosamine-3-kinase
VRTAIATHTGEPLGACEVRPAAGGDTHESYTLVALTPRFLKVNLASALGQFEAEAEALREIAATGTIRVPTPLVCEVWEDQSFLMLEYLALHPGASHQYQKMGAQLAALHRTVSANGQFGWHRANFIGPTPQPNAWSPSWPDFWRNHRLGFQLKLAARKGTVFRGSDQLLEQVSDLLAGHEPVPSLLHGDLWGGNAAFDEHGQPVLYDPASYYGDRECDLAFAELFGGFAPSFFEAYDAAWPRPSGWQQRRDLYNLYHLLNHFNLFGASYAPQVQQIMDRLNRGG